MTAAARPRSATEAQLMAGLMSAVKALDGAVYHTYDARGSDKGYPDLTCILANRTVWWLEVKGPRGSLSDDQVDWLDRLGGSRAWCVWPDEQQVESARRRWPTVVHATYDDVLRWLQAEATTP